MFGTVLRTTSATVLQSNSSFSARIWSHAAAIFLSHSSLCFFRCPVSSAIAGLSFLKVYQKPAADRMAEII